jgi:Uma2 family endonuclease
MGGLAVSITELPTTSSTESVNVRLFTIADVDAMPTSLPSGDVDYELHEGRLIVVSPPGRRHGSVQARIGALLMKAENAGLGEAFVEVGIVLDRGPDSLVGADAAFVSQARCPVRDSKEGYLETIPDLVVEIRSKDNTMAELKRKADLYLKAGVRVVWLIDPFARNVLIYRGTSEPITLKEDAVITDPDILPGHELCLADLLKD